jgi:hypothetical protein
MNMQRNFPRAVVKAIRGSLKTRFNLAELVGFIGLLCLLVYLLAFGQATPAAPQAGQNASPQGVQNGRASLSHLYWHFLLYQSHLDKTAAAREQQGKDGNWLRNHYQQRLGFKDTDFALVREAAARLESDFQRIDSEVRTIIKADRARHPRVLSSPHDLPPVPRRLLELRDEREAVMQSDLDSLRGALSPELVAKLDAFLEKEFAPNVKIQYMGPPRPHDPTKRTVPPFPAEAQ